ncbi:beta-galactosidase [Dactylosporangium salmoneum]|uniref:Glycoside hydrolase 35 catalytic domain-containing protein n=1 Tax=Dactylosporangium salmoneum TaxID=53361 RepID=A0ABP5SPD6_9ACTN
MGDRLTGRGMLRDGRPWIPVSGELHYSRVPRARWAERLELMRSGGVSVVSTYVPWIHHEPRRGEASFAGGLDLAAFLDLCAATGLDTVLRIGPWVHGELRNGGFPDWVRESPVAHRSDDPAYLELVREWFGRIGGAVAGRVPLAVQLENELLDDPGHLVTLKRLALGAGIAAPLWTATAWDGARLPEGEVVPVYSGYGDGFWADADAPWDPAFRAQFRFSHAWDPPRPAAPPGPVPPITCELGGGMATAYHRRPRPSGRDVAAVAHCKLGSGSVWQGYYMYAGGTNPPGVAVEGQAEGTHESHATGYPNDVPRLGYDFHAPIGEAGTLSAGHAELRRQHAFLAAFAEELTAAPSWLPGGDGLRWAVRGAFLFIAWHQPHEPLATYPGARFTVGGVELPSRPVDIPPGTLARWPVGLEAGGVRLRWATASALTVLPGAVPTLVLCADEGIPVEVAGVGEVEPGRSPLRLRDGAAGLDLLVLTPGDSAIAWVREGERRLLLSAADLGWGADGRIVARGAGPAPEVLEYDPAAGAFRPLPLRPDGPGAPAQDVVARPVRQFRPPRRYGERAGRASAPSARVFDELAAVYALDLPGWAGESDALLHIDWAGDVAELRIDGRAATDRFWDGSHWVVSLRDAGYGPGREVTLHVLPLDPGAPVHLPEDARRRADAAGGPLLAVDRVRVEARRAWRVR